jgi:2,3-bisphosphoglycerate-dependent phosphoglycerate mutase
MSFEAAFASALSRTQHTLDLILKEIGQTDIPTTYSMAINERDYGDLSGISKLEAKEQWGEEQVRLWRRSYDVAPPNGESLKDTVARVLPFYCTEILPRVMRGESTIVVAHGNSLRALCMALDKLTPESVSSLEISTADLIIYQLNSDTPVASKKIFKSLKAIHDS